MYIVMMIILSFFAVVGITHFITALIDAVFYRDDKSSYLLIVPDPSAEDAEIQLRAALSHIRPLYRGRVIALCDKPDGELKSILECIARDFGSVEILTRQELIHKIEKPSLDREG